MKPEITVTIKNTPDTEWRVADMEEGGAFLYSGYVYVKRAWGDGNCMRLAGFANTDLPPTGKVDQVFSRVQITVTP